jgi:pyroglutamyl-peptidase
MKWLVTAFEPFAEWQTNSSLIVLQQLRERDWQGQVQFASPVPVSFSQAWPFVAAQLQRAEFDGVLCLGQTEARRKVSVERLALNWVDCKTPDNDGAIPPYGKILAGPALLWSPIPWQKFSGNCERSYSAGTYVCNTLMYHTLQWCQERGKLGGFVHIPLLASQDAKGIADSEVSEICHEILRFLLGLR